MEYSFYDPNHGGCLRTIRKVGANIYLIVGAYGSDEGRVGYWSAFAKKIKPKILDGKKYNLEVDFTHKEKIKHSKIYLANWRERKIFWQDGNIWQQLYA